MLDRVRPRRFRLFGVGNGKSGTTTLAAMLGAYRSAHEVDNQRLRDLAADVVAGGLDRDSDAVRTVLRRRSRQYRLEADIAGFLSDFVGPLARLHADAQFVLPIRDCFSWLNSRVEHTVRFPYDDATRFHVVRFARHDDVYAPEERALEAAGVRPIAAYLRAWADINAGVLADAPSARLLVIRTEELDAAPVKLGAFLGVDPATIRVEHRNRNESPSGLLAAVAPEFVLEQAQTFCAPLMERFWGRGWPRLAGLRLPH